VHHAVWDRIGSGARKDVELLADHATLSLLGEHHAAPRRSGARAGVERKR
jgi:hypothetical protein